MRTYMLKRVLGVIPTVLMITLVVFVMMRSVPGDPVVPLLGDAYTEEDAIKVREAYGLNNPLPVKTPSWSASSAKGTGGPPSWTGGPGLRAVWSGFPARFSRAGRPWGWASAT